MIQANPIHTVARWAQAGAEFAAAQGRRAVRLIANNPIIMAAVVCSIGSGFFINALQSQQTICSDIEISPNILEISDLAGCILRNTTQFSHEILNLCIYDKPNLIQDILMCACGSIFVSWPLICDSLRRKPANIPELRPNIDPQLNADHFRIGAQEEDLKEPPPEATLDELNRIAKEQGTKDEVEAIGKIVEAVRNKAPRLAIPEDPEKRNNWYRQYEKVLRLITAKLQGLTSTSAEEKKE